MRSESNRSTTARRKFYLTGGCIMHRFFIKKENHKFVIFLGEAFQVRFEELERETLSCKDIEA